MSTTRNLAIAGSVAIGVYIYPIVKNIVSDILQVLALMMRQKAFTQRSKQRNQERSGLKTPESPLYVALGSSFAAGPLVGDSVPGAIGAGQGSLGYPFLLAKKLGLSKDQFVNAASSGALLSEVDATQLKFLGPETKLVTLTAGGNDVNYSRDSMLAAFLKQLKTDKIKSYFERTYTPSLPASERPFEQLSNQFDRTLQEIHRRSPHAIIAIVTYITVMPPNGELDPLSESQTTELRNVAEKLRSVTVDAAHRNCAVVIDMAAASVSHYAGSSTPWAHGFSGDSKVATVHPNEAGHAASADKIYETLLQHKYLPELTSS